MRAQQNLMVFIAAFSIFLMAGFVYLQQQNSVSGPTIKILFIGNSYTFVHDVPATLKKIARSKGKSLTVAMAVKPGATWEDHARNAETLQTISSNQWDYVVLQEQSQRMAFDGEQLERQSFAPAIRIVEHIRHKLPNASILLYNTWGRKHGDKQNCAAIADVCTYDGMQQRINAAYGQLALRIQGEIVPIGNVWRHVRQNHPTIELYEPDENHQSPAGAYLAAATFFKIIFHEPVTGAKAIGIDAGVAQTVQAAVDNMVP